jgi:hypothetical protein
MPEAGESNFDRLIAFRATFRRRRFAVAGVEALMLVSLLAAGAALAWSDTDTSNLILRVCAGCVVLLFAVLVLFWSCPSCGRSLGPPWRGSYCCHCGRVVDPDSLSKGASWSEPPSRETLLSLNRRAYWIVAGPIEGMVLALIAVLIGTSWAGWIFLAGFLLAFFGRFIMPLFLARCPNCKHSLGPPLVSRYSSFRQKPYEYCGSCGIPLLVALKDEG